MLTSGGSDAVLNSLRREGRGLHTTPQRMGDFRTVWTSAATAAGVPNLTFHDLRRTAVTNMRKAGIPRELRKQVSGHETDSMHDRYGIIDEEDITSVRDKMGALLADVMTGD